jgi:hypothetical protein
LKKNSVYILFLYYLLIIATNPNYLYADSIHISGIVQDENNGAVENAEVTFYNRNAIKVYTDKSGFFELSGMTGISTLKHNVPITPSVIISNNCIRIDLRTENKANIAIFTADGRKFLVKSTFLRKEHTITCNVPLSDLPTGFFLLHLHSNENSFTYTCVVTGNHVQTSKNLSEHYRSDITFSKSSASDFKDILIVSANGFQTVRRAVTAATEDNIKVKLMKSGVGYITPTIPVYSDKGGTGDVTTYGSASDPENSQGGACNYGSTKIKYYAAINVNQFPGDKTGQWQDGQICGRCARVRIRTVTGEERTTVVRIVDKCPDDNCGIDLGGAPAGEIMKTQTGRYAGEWEWVTCDSVEGVSDGSPSLYIKTGSNQWWSLIQARNGPGSVEEMRVRKIGTTEWQILKWATEAENFLKLPEKLLQDSGEWEIEVQWNTGSISNLKIAGNKLSIENAVYDLQK